MTANEVEDLVVELAQRVEVLEEHLRPHELVASTDESTLPELELQHRKFVDELRERERKEG